MRFFLSYGLLLAVKYVSRLAFRRESHFVGEVPTDRWEKIRIVAILNHTSLYEPIFASLVPNSFLRRIARVGTVPIADKTARRPIVGSFFRLVAGNVIPVTRKRDDTWRQVLQALEARNQAGGGSDSMAIILPEGRMMRADGLDSKGRPMTVRGGIADLLLAIPDGRMLLAYSGGLHHVQIPGERFPRLGKTIHMDFEVLEIAAYRERLLAQAGPRGFRAAVIEEMEHRRDTLCPVERTRRSEHGRRTAAPEEASDR